MYDILRKKSEYWNERLRACMKNGGYTQVSLAEALNKKYRCNESDKQLTQKTISRWLTIGNLRSGGKQSGFPEYESMLMVADFFGVDIGYLTGETDEDSFDQEKACSYLGLNGEAIKAIRQETSPENESSYLRKGMRETFNKFLSSNEFPRFFNSLYSLYQSSISPEGHQEFKKLDAAIDYMYTIEQRMKIERYELNEDFILLVNDICPKPSMSDLSIKESVEEYFQNQDRYYEELSRNYERGIKKQSGTMPDDNIVT